ncbi:hypothetical protein BOP96_10135 [Pseudomonas sp. FSL W5-0203]|uniref:hypothetical protein n=1 Tax=Pseudomonas sp. FSL W5-0203 TaxID=1920491 RepID=UPI0009366341|nr:hypothetical protein [Pseudomonas sp. FSL W5-0203]OJT30933.1 hypothetical protein BOP96_10135 [Pseudomonas sp. FSL W5-0203]
MSSPRLIIDTNLLLLLVIGAIEEGRHISSSSRLKSYNEEDYQVVVKFMGRFTDVYITPYIATEVSNLIDLNGYARIMAFEAAQLLFSQFQQIDSNISADSAAKLFSTYGLTDTSLIGLVSDYTILTNDGRMSQPLYAAAAKTECNT